MQIFIPSYSLAFEYQGETHYYSTQTFGSAAERQRVDLLKQEHAKQSGITLIPIQFWWTKDIPSLAATIMQHRPDIELGAQKALPISSQMPSKLLNQKFYYKPNAAQRYHPLVDTTSW
jgi:hypothetical protein